MVDSTGEIAQANAFARAVFGGSDGLPPNAPAVKSAAVTTILAESLSAPAAAPSPAPSDSPVTGQN